MVGIGRALERSAKDCRLCPGVAAETFLCRKHGYEWDGASKGLADYVEDRISHNVVGRIHSAS
jgi:hypothetical protein